MVRHLRIIQNGLTTPTNRSEKGERKADKTFPTERRNATHANDG